MALRAALEELFARERHELELLVSRQARAVARRAVRIAGCVAAAAVARRARRLAQFRGLAAAPPRGVE